MTTRAERQRQASRRVASANRIERATVSETRRAYRAAINAATEGNPQTAGQRIESIIRREVIPTVARGAVLAYLRSANFVLNAARPALRRRQTNLANIDEIEAITARLGLEPDRIERLGFRYESLVGQASEGAIAELRQKVSQAVAGAIQDNLIQSGIEDAIVDAIRRSGFAPADPWAVETLARTQTRIATASGQAEALADPDIAEVHIGYEYATVGDDRVREDHAVLDGFTAPKDDPAWDTRLPPNGWNCRCIVIEIYEGDEDLFTGQSPGADADPGFDRRWDVVTADEVGIES